MHTTEEWIGFAVVVSLVGAMASVMMWIAGTSRGIPRRKLSRALITLWASMLMCVAGLAVARSILGGGVVDYSLQDDAPVAVRPLSPGGWAVVAGGFAWAMGWLMVALRTAQGITGGKLRLSDTNEPTKTQ